MEYETDRPGANYRSFDLPEALCELCQAECARDVKCKAYTCVKPTEEGSAARCFLKSRVPNRMPSSRCVSGVKLADPLPDLSISAIEILPHRPRFGVDFALNVYATNAGQVASGDFEVSIFIKDKNRGNIYPVGTFRKRKMHPGENYTIYSSTKRLVNDPGIFEVHVEIKPFKTDANEHNNRKIKTFTVY